jgi:hypothetical protein
MLGDTLIHLNILQKLQRHIAKAILFSDFIRKHNCFKLIIQTHLHVRALDYCVFVSIFITAINIYIDLTK